jgi:hypothetical protein
LIKDRTATALLGFIIDGTAFLSYIEEETAFTSFSLY